MVRPWQACRPRPPPEPHRCPGVWEPHSWPHHLLGGHRAPRLISAFTGHLQPSRMSSPCSQLGHLSPAGLAVPCGPRCPYRHTAPDHPCGLHTPSRGLCPPVSRRDESQEPSRLAAFPSAPQSLSLEFEQCWLCRVRFRPDLETRNWRRSRSNFPPAGRQTFVPTGATPAPAPSGRKSPPAQC